MASAHVLEICPFLLTLRPFPHPLPTPSKKKPAPTLKASVLCGVIVTLLLMSRVDNVYYGSVHYIYPLGGAAFFTAPLSISLKPLLGQQQNLNDPPPAKGNVKPFVNPHPHHPLLFVQMI